MWVGDAMTARINFVGDIALFKKYEKLKIDPFEAVWLPESGQNAFSMNVHVSRISSLKSFPYLSPMPG